MRKLLLLSALVSLFTYQSKAAYTTVNNTTGTVVYAGISVTVGAVPGRTNPTPSSTCGSGPYYIGAGSGNPQGGYRYVFNPTDKVTHLRLTLTDFHSDDTVYVAINGTPYSITNAMLSANAGCAAPFAATTVGGKVACTALASVVTSAVVTIPYGPSFIQTVDVLHDNKWSGGSGGAIYKFEFNVDSCNQPFAVTIDSPYCSSRDIKLYATGFPNTTYSWTKVSTPGPFTAWSSTQQNPIVIAPPYTGKTDYYICTATRGACTYVDTIKKSTGITLQLTPQLPIMSYKGPKCISQQDTINIKSNLTGGGYYVIIKPNGSTQIPGVAPYDFIELPNIQLSDAGTYRGVAVSSGGCASDTASMPLNLNPPVTADFTWDNKLGCASDSIQFTDQSLGNNTWAWDFGDTKSSTDANPLNVYASQGTYVVKLIVSNGKCFDTVGKQLILNHPLVADFDISADSICQGKSVDFTNKSIATPATIPYYWWDFKDGAVDSIFNPSHKYTKYGVYNVTMTITDYLGCKKTATKTVVVDSLGSASFFSDTIICAGESIQFLGDYSEIGGTYARWDFADGHTIDDKFTIEHAFINPGTYDVQLTAHYRICPDTTYNQNIVVRPYPTIDLGKDTSLCPDGESFVIKELINAGDPNLHYRWNTETKDTTWSIQVHHPGVYAVTVDRDGCAVTDTLEVKKNCYIDIPNVFTPNNDGYNDYFLPRQLLSRNITKFSMSIYNRWGDIVFETSKTDGRGWDGKVNDKPQPTGVYVYMIKVSFANGTNENYQGNITLLR